MQADKSKKSEQVFTENTARNQFVANKNFFNQNGNWIDAEYREEAKLPEVKIKFASAEYFDLVAAQPNLAEYLALGKQVTFVWNKKVYRIVE